MKRLYAAASLVGAERIVFDIKGNDDRLAVAVDFEKAIVRTEWIDTHEDDDQTDVAELEHGGWREADPQRGRL